MHWWKWTLVPYVWAEGVMTPMDADANVDRHWSQWRPILIPMDAEPGPGPDTDINPNPNPDINNNTDNTNIDPSTNHNDTDTNPDPNTDIKTDIVPDTDTDHWDSGRMPGVAVMTGSINLWCTKVGTKVELLKMKGI